MIINAGIPQGCLTGPRAMLSIFHTFISFSIDLPVKIRDTQLSNWSHNVQNKYYWLCSKDVANCVMDFRQLYSNKKVYLDFFNFVLSMEQDKIWLKPQL